MKSLCGLVCVLGVGLSSGAQAQLTVAFAAGAGGNDSVRVSIAASQRGGELHIPAGTLVSTGDGLQQDLVLGEAVDIELQPNQRRAVTVSAYCVHSSRSVPNAGNAMERAGASEQALQRLMAVEDQFSHHVLQSAVWAYRDGSPPSDEMVAKALLVAGVVVK